ncbi:MAG: hypothetical protein Q8O51_00195 [bacterium]|nr:hypothetical protein [bacterium]
MPVQPTAPKPEQEPVDIFEVVDRVPEHAPEVKPEKVREALEQHGSRFEQHPEVPSQVKELPSQVPLVTMPLPVGAEEQQLKQIETVLSEGLHDIFVALPPAEQQKFKVAGELAAREVSGLLAQVKVKLGAVIAVLRRWLGTLPGVNKFFVEQEAKIKAEKLVRLVAKEE